MIMIFFDGWMGTSVFSPHTIVHSIEQAGFHSGLISEYVF